MPAIQLPNGKQQFLDINGDPLGAGSVFSYIPNSTTFKDTFKDPGFVTLNTNPILLDAGGEAVIFGNGAYRQIVYDVLGNLQWDEITQGWYTGFNAAVTVNPTLITQTGTLSNANCTVLYYTYQSVDTSFARYYVTVNVVTNGTGAGALVFNLPFISDITMDWVGGKTGTSSGLTLWTITQGSTAVKVSDASGNYPGSDGVSFAAMLDMPIL